MNEPKFPMTPDGYADARDFLKLIGKWDQVSNSGFSTDGYSIVHEANHMYEAKEQYIKDLEL